MDFFREALLVASIACMSGPFHTCWLTAALSACNFKLTLSFFHKIKVKNLGGVEVEAASVFLGQLPVRV
jgi:hypothetical protein